MDKLASTGAMAAATIRGCQDDELRWPMRRTETESTIVSCGPIQDPAPATAMRSGSSAAISALRSGYSAPLLLCATLVVSTTFAVTPAHAQSWTGTTSGDWFTGTNWTPNGVPAAGMNVSIDTQTPNPAIVSGGPTAILGQLVIGQLGTGTLTIQKGQSGGVVTDAIGYLGYFAGSNGNVTVTGSGSHWTNTNSLFVGYDGSGTLNIQSGGGVNTSSAVVGRHAGSAGFVNIDGGFLNSTGQIRIGEVGNGTFTVQNGGGVTNSFAIVGDAAGVTGTVTVNGNGSMWTSSSDLTVGNFGIGALTIQNGAIVTNDNAIIAANLGSTGTVVVDNGTWSSGSGLHVGEGGAGTLTIQNGGAVNNNGNGIVGFMAGSSGTVNVTGAGSTWTNGSVAVGLSGTGLVTIQNGGFVSNDSGQIGYFAGSTGTVLVDNGTWTNSGQLSVGLQGSGILALQNGGAVNSPFAEIGAGSGSTGAVRVNNGTWNNTGAITIGSDGSGKLTVQNGGAVNAGHVQLAAAAGSAGILNIGADPGSAAAAPGTLNTPTISFGAGAGQINFNHTSTNYVFTPALSGIGRLNQYAGTTTLTGDSSGFSGATFVGGGRLLVNGSLAGSAVTVASGGFPSGILGGSGTIGGLVVNAGGTVAPGNSIGTLNVAGNINFGSGSIYQVETNATGQSDKIVAGGTATINGGSVQVLAGMGNYAPATTYTILTAAGGRSGAFDTVTSNLVFLDPSLSYDPTNVYLTLTRNNTSFAAVGITPNQIATGGAVDGLAFGNPLYNAVLNLSSVQARSAFDQLSGEIHASAKGVMVEDSRFARDAALDRLRAAFDDVGAVRTPVMAYADGGPTLTAADTDRFALWGRGFGAWGTISGDGNAATLKRDIGGLFVGADGLVTDAIRLGVLGGYSHSDFRVTDRASSDRSDNYHVGIYGGSHWGDLAFRSGAALTWHNLSTNRAVAFPGFADSLTSQSIARTAQIFGDIGYTIRAGQLGVEPFGNLAHVNVASGAFTEKGGTAALTSPGDSTDVTLTTLGLRGSNVFTMAHGPFMTARSTVGWQHAFGNVTPLATLAFAGGIPFGIAGAPIARDAAVIDVGLDLELTSSAVLALSYGGQFGRALTDQSVKGSFAWKF